MCAERDTGTSEQRTAAFSRALASLRETGSNLLLVGAAHDAARSQACQRFLGESGTEPRRRLFVTTEPNGVATDVMRELYTRTGPQSTAVIEQRNTVRSAAAQSASAAPVVPRTTVDDGDLVGLGGTIESSIAEFDREAHGLDPAEFRLCFDSLRPLFLAHDEEQVFAFLHVVTEHVKDVQGMAHYHLPLNREAETVKTIEPLFDAVVEVRIQDSYPQQRWHLREEGVTTDWLSL